DPRKQNKNRKTLKSTPNQIEDTIDLVVDRLNAKLKQKLTNLLINSKLDPRPNKSKKIKDL
ncbi:23990_t:CDS:2, partial [Cetraspora pellucida]